jgi:hypothetical protein
MKNEGFFMEVKEISRELGVGEEEPIWRRSLGESRD